MKKKLLLTAVIAFSIYSQVFPQAQLSIRKSATAQWVENAVTSAFFLSRQSFQVSDKNTGNLYGLNNRDEFGTEISLGMKVRGGYILSNRAIQPWEFNPKYDNYRDGYAPVFYRSQYTEVGETAKYDSLSLEKSKSTELQKATLYFISSDTPFGDGLTIDSTSGEKNGWVVWACADSITDLNKTAQLSFISYSKPLKASKDSNEDIEVPDGTRILGGIYVIPITAGIGMLEFSLCGIMVENDGKWSIRFPFIGNEKLFIQGSKSQVKDKSIEETEKETESTDDLYPVTPPKKNNKKKNKK